MNANIDSTGSGERRAVVSDAVLEQALGDASVVGFAWLLLTDYELTQLANGIIEPTVQRMAERTA